MWAFELFFTNFTIKISFLSLRYRFYAYLQLSTTLELIKITSNKIASAYLLGNKVAD